MSLVLGGDAAWSIRRSRCRQDMVTAEEGTHGLGWARHGPIPKAPSTRSRHLCSLPRCRTVR
jgi:hypothetical protein